MIQYTLKCSKGHSFDSWFKSAEAYEKLVSAGMVMCSVCGDTHVDKAIMAPRVTPARKASSEPLTPSSQAGPLSKPASAAERALAELKAYVETNTEDVGLNFAREARAMHDGDMPERAIRGEANPDEARALVEDGVPIVALPFARARKTN